MVAQCLLNYKLQQRFESSFPIYNQQFRGIIRNTHKPEQIHRCSLAKNIELLKYLYIGVNHQMLNLEDIKMNY